MRQVIKREWESTKNGNNWFYMETVKYPFAKAPSQIQLGAVTRITDTRSPNFNKWATSMKFEETQLFSTKREAMAYVVAIKALT